MSLRIRPATEADLDQIGTLMTAAFHPSTDPISSRLFPNHLQPSGAGDPIRPWRLARKTASLGSGHTTLMVCVDNALDGIVVGFALWEIPGTGNPDEKPAPEVPSAALDKDAWAELRRVTSADVTKHFGERGTKDVWHLDYLGVDPQQQRRGIGKLLLNWGVEQAKSAGMDCYLIATPAGKPLYLATGFEDLDLMMILGAPHYSMLMRNRPAKQAVN